MSATCRRRYRCVMYPQFSLGSRLEIGSDAIPVCRCCATDDMAQMWLNLINVAIADGRVEGT
jgi:hypothetical protein